MTYIQHRIPVFYLLFLTILIGFGVMTSCKPKEKNNDVQLKFSTSIVTFDTVFTSIGSVTKRFTVKNTSKDEITTTIFLAGKNSYFSMNVDGEAGTYFKNVVIPKKDSIFVFVTVKINPKNENNPYLVTDSIVFITGKHVQDVKLLAYGQDARYIVADPKTGFKIIAGEHETVTWNKERPYVVYGWAAIDSLGTLEIEPGTKIYFHKNSGLWASPFSELNVNGTKDEPVLFRGDRLEAWYDNDFAQWNGIWINEGAEVTINNAIITNARTGVQLNPFVTEGGITVTVNSLVKIDNTIIKNTEKSGVWAMFLNLDMTNCVIANNGSCSLQLEGGKYKMKHLTVVNHFMQAERKVPACYVSNVVSAFNDEPWDVNAAFINCIITGRNEDEVIVNKKGNKSLEASFQNCLIRAKNDLKDYFKDCLRNEDPKFEAQDKLNFKLMPGSKAIGNGKTLSDVTLDILGIPRKNPPDIGAYEFQ